MTRLRAWLPLLLTLLGAVLFGGLWAWRIAALGPTPAGMLAAAAGLSYGLWLLWESRVSARERVRLEVDRDHGTLELAAGAKYALLAACLLPPAAPALPIGGLGLALLALGALWRVRAVVYLGSAYGHRIRSPHLPLVTDGPYALVRHPAYLGTLLAHGGVTLVFASPWSIAALLLFWVPAVLVRVALEDRFLRSIPEYAAYARRVPSKLIPRLIQERSVSRLQSKLPILLSVASAALMAVLTVRKLASWRGEFAWVGALTIGLYLAWLVVETRVAAGEIGKGDTRLDRGTLELYALGRVLTVGAALVLQETCEVGALAAWAGVVLFVTGVGLRLASIRELGRFYSHRVRLTAGQTVVESGPYRYLRHPAYTGMLLAHVGFVVLFFHWLSLAALVLVFLPSVVLRVHIEEHALARSVAGYAEYCRGRRRLIPRIW